ncbi:MAG: cytochrome [Sphingomonadales bacterium]|nr:cytochrome [Sphingomonadales bacterium]
MTQPSAEITREPIFEFDYINDDMLKGDVHDGYWKIKESAPPVFWTPANGGHWVLNSGAAVTQVLLDSKSFTSRYVTIPATTYTPVVIPTTLDSPEHGPYRRLLQPFFEPAAIKPLENRIIEWTNKLIDDIIDSKQCEFVEGMASRLPVSIFMELMGLPLEDFDMFRELVVLYFNAQADMVERGRRADEIMGHMKTLIAERRKEPRDDLVSKLIAARLVDRPLNQEELMSICFNMFVGGLDTVVNGMSFGMLHLARNAPLRQRLIDDPSRSADLAEELLRRYPVINTRRYVISDVDVQGVKMKAGDPVLVPTMMLGWDEAANACPHLVTLDREGRKHSAFGFGRHVCLGAHLARLELSVFYNIWFQRIGHFSLTNPDEALEMRAGTVMAIKRLNISWT